MPRASRLQNIVRQPPNAPMTPPTIGAATVATPFMALMRDIVTVRLSPLYLSVAMLLESTTAPDPDRPWNRRMTMNCQMLLAKMQPAVVVMNMIMAVISGFLRPYLSLIGPKRSCPAAKPIKPVVNPSWTRASEVMNQEVMDGKTGRYMSITNGPKALNVPRKIRRNAPVYFMLNDFMFQIAMKRPHLFMLGPDFLTGCKFSSHSRAFPFL